MTVKSYNSPEEMFADVQRDRSEADRHVEDWQRSVLPGDKIIRVVDQDGLLLIYGEVIDPIASEKEHYDLEDPMEAAEFEYVQRQFSKEWARSYRYGKFYSTQCPEGEHRQLHLATITGVLTEAEFKDAREQGWPQDFGFARTVYTRRSQN